MKKATPIFIVLIFSIVVIYDLFIIMNQGKLESVSAYLIRWAYDYPTLPFGVGFLCGHLFWRMREQDVWRNK